VKPEITIFTPTYNRAYLLPNLYKSLVNQTDKNFEWIVVDDGSEDETESLILKFQSENRIPIKYFKQENKGKHKAQNFGVQFADSDYFLCIDSDDFLSENCVEHCKKVISEINDQKEYAGFTFIHATIPKEKNTKDLKKSESSIPKKYSSDATSELIFCYRTEIVKKFPYPEFEGEKFIQESIVYNRIRKHQYKILSTNLVLAFGDYWEDGLSFQLYNLMLKNPRGAMLRLKERMEEPQQSRVQRKKYAEMYWDIALKSKHISWKEKLSGLSFYWTLKVLTRKFFKKIFSNF
jgi:glycosyltransferase involved in cell wall biosynthesis